MTLADLSVKEPCPERWEEMDGDERARHCARCDLRVVHLSELEEAEAEALLTGRAPGERLCVRFVRGPDGSVVTRTTGYRRLISLLGRLSEKRWEG